MNADATRMNGKPEVMVVDDDPAMREFLRDFLAARGYRPVAFATAEEAVAQYSADRPAAVILDVIMPGAMDGLQALAVLKKIDGEVPVIVLSGQGRTATVVQAMKLGATDFVCKPFEDTDLEVPLANALAQRRLSREIASLRDELQACSRHAMVSGDGERMREVRELIERAADTDVTVLISGESGTGKELVARALHAASLRRDKPFVKVNCAALPGELLESELFGFERGAFTGAIQHKPGKFEFANHGTMFLDEISEMSPALQAKLLQVLQDGEFARLGGKHDVRVDARIIAATNRDLEHAIAVGQFREDLYFRINVVSIRVPPLRERGEDIPLLVEHFLKKHSVQFNKPYSPVSQATMSLFMEYDWPGNVRELENLIKRTVVLGSEATSRKEISHAITMAAHRSAIAAAPPPRLSVADRMPFTPIPTLDVTSLRPAAPAVCVARPAMPATLAPTSAAPAPDPGTCSLKAIARSAARKAERELILKMLQQTRWNRKETAEILGLSYKALLYKIKENGLDRAS